MTEKENQTEVDFLRGRVVDLEKKLLNACFERDTARHELDEARIIITKQEQDRHKPRKGMDTDYQDP